MSVEYQPSVSRASAECRSSVSRVSAEIWTEISTDTIGRVSAEMSVEYRPALSIKCRPRVGRNACRVSAECRVRCRSSISRVSVECRPSIGQVSVECRSSVGLVSFEIWTKISTDTIGQVSAEMSVEYRPALSVECRPSVGRNPG